MSISTRTSAPASFLTADHRLSRRLAVGGGLGVAAAAAGTILAQPLLATAQDATAEATPSDALQPGGAEIDPQMQEVLDALTSFDAPALEDGTPEIGRELPSFADALQQVLTARGEPSQEIVGDIRHILIPGLDDNQILARLYYPTEAGSGLLPVAVYFHGGGFVIASVNTYDASCRALANATGCIVASIAYRLAPEHPFPAAVNDAYAATQFFLSTAGEVGGDPERVAVVGESAGGNLATVVCLRARDEDAPMPVHQGLVYPLVTFAPEGEATESIETYANAVPLNAAALDWFGSYYLTDPSEASDPFTSPLDVDDLSGLPPATIIQAQIDPLQSQGTLYAEALEEAGVEVTRSLYEGVTHEFFGMGAVADKAADAVAELAGELQAAFEA
jgi:acetyl esterase